MKTITLSYCHDEGKDEIYKHVVNVSDYPKNEIVFYGIRGELDFTLNGEDKKYTIPIEFDSIKIKIDNSEDETGLSPKTLDRIMKCIIEAFKVKK